MELETGVQQNPHTVPLAERNYSLDNSQLPLTVRTSYYTKRDIQNAKFQALYLNSKGTSNELRYQLIVYGLFVACASGIYILAQLALFSRALLSNSALKIHVTAVCLLTGSTIICVVGTIRCVFMLKHHQSLLTTLTGLYITYFSMGEDCIMHSLVGEHEAHSYHHSPLFIVLFLLMLQRNVVFYSFPYQLLLSVYTIGLQIVLTYIGQFPSLTTRWTDVILLGVAMSKLLIDCYIIHTKTHETFLQQFYEQKTQEQDTCVAGSYYCECLSEVENVLDEMKERLLYSDTQQQIKQSIENIKYLKKRLPNLPNLRNSK